MTEQRSPVYRCRHEEWTENPGDVISVDEHGRALYDGDAKKVCLVCGCLDVDADLVNRYRAAHPASTTPADPVTLHAPATRPDLAPTPGLIDSEHPWRIYAGSVLALTILAVAVYLLTK